MLINNNSDFADDVTYIVSFVAFFVFAVILTAVRCAQLDEYNVDNDAKNMKAKTALLEEVIQEHFVAKPQTPVQVNTECKGCLNRYNVIPMVFK